MKTYQVVLTKSYIVTIQAETAEKAKHLAEFYTGDIQDISKNKDRKTLNFSVENIKCGMNESFETIEL